MKVVQTPILVVLPAKWGAGLSNVRHALGLLEAVWSLRQQPVVLRDFPCRLWSPWVSGHALSLLDEGLCVLVESVQIVHGSSVLEHSSHLDTSGNQLEYMTIIL